MKCRKCGAVLLDTDTFCVKCGQRVDQPMFCSNCGEQLREGERFCHKCGSPVESVEEDEEIPLSQQRTVDIPFEEIEQGILMEAEQAIVKRPGAGRPERRSAEGYSRPGTEEAERPRQSPLKSEEHYRQLPEREADTDDDYEESGEEYGTPVRPVRQKPPVRTRYREDYDDYDEEEEEDDEESGDSKMKLVTIILGIAVVAVALVIGFIFWQRNGASRVGRPEESEQGEEQDGEEDDGETGAVSADTQGRIQILSNVNVRNKPTTEGSEVIMVAKTGETYEYYELVDGAWYHIKLEDGGEGYVSEKYVEDLK